MLVLSHADVLAALRPGECERAMAEILAARARGETHMPLRTVVAPPGAEGFMGLMPAWRDSGGPHGAAFALKALCIMPANPSRGLDSHQGTVTLFDPGTGAPTALLDASALTEVRTAAVSAVATRLLARADASVLAILGAGVQGRAHLRALAPVREFAEVRVYSRTRARAEALAHGVGRVVRVCASAEEAVRGADVVVAATSAREPVLARAWLHAGAHVNAVGASVPDARELDTAILADAALFVDSRESLRHEAGEFQLAVREGAIPGEEHIRAELGEVLAGLASGRRDHAEITLFRSLGLAVEDLAAAQHAVAAAHALGLGTEVEL